MDKLYFIRKGWSMQCSSNSLFKLSATHCAQCGGIAPMQGSLSSCKTALDLVHWSLPVPMYGAMTVSVQYPALQPRKFNLSLNTHVFSIFSVPQRCVLPHLSIQAVTSFLPFFLRNQQLSSPSFLFWACWQEIFAPFFFSFFFVFNFFVCCNVFYTSKVRLSIVKRTWENMAWLEQSMGPWEKNTLRITYITVTAGVDKQNFVLGKQNDFLAFSEKIWKCWVD